MSKTDTQLKHDVQAELIWDPEVNEAHIGVQCEKGVITLSGHVPDFSQKWAAEQAALRVGEVRALAVDIHVDLSDPGTHTDVDVSRSVANVLDLMSPEYSQRIKIMVEEGWLTLSGDVEWNFQRNAVLRYVSHVRGVKGVSNDINIHPIHIARDVKEEVRAALQRRAIQDIDAITISIDGPDIILSGSVHSWSEKSLVKHAVLCTPGVRNVTDNVKVIFE